MTDEQKNLLFEYEELKIKEKSTKDRIDQIKGEVLELVPEGQQMQARFGKFKRMVRSEWKYSDNTVRMMDELKEIQKDEKQTGEAEEVPGVIYVQYNQDK